MSDHESGSVDRRPALIITGMHRSGTSLTAALCQSAGLFLGKRLMPGYAGNEQGHYEDMDVVGFHRRTLVANGLSTAGFDIGPASLSLPDAEQNLVRSLVAERRALAVPWGWKDPRGTLFLPFWANAVPEARFLLVFRRPWEVVDSLFRRNGTDDQVFRKDVLRSIGLWCHYNTLLRDFAHAHRGRVLVRNINQIVASPSSLMEDIGRHLDIPLGPPLSLYEPRRMTTGAAADRECLVALAAPKSLELYAELCDLAGAGEAGDAGRAETPAVSACERAFADWAAASVNPSLDTVGDR